MASISLAAFTNEGFTTVPSAMTYFNSVYDLKMVKMEKEIWKDVIDYEGFYQVSNIGRIKSIDRIVPRGNGNLTIKGQIMTQIINNRGYLSVSLCRNAKYKHMVVHKLELLAFKDNPENKPFGNHKDGIKTNNILTNLEWATCSENNQHAYDTGLKTGVCTGKFGKDNPSSKPLCQMDKNTMEVLNDFDSVHDVYRKLGFAVTNIAAACRGSQYTSHGYIWKYKNELS